MKIATLTCVGIGLLSALLAVLTALGAVPGFVDFDLGFGEDVITTACWGGLSVLVLLAAIGFGIIAPKE